MERHLNWLNKNSFRKYPFCDYVSTLLPMNFVVNINVVVPQSVYMPLYIKKLSLMPFGFSAEIADKNGIVVCATTCRILGKDYSSSKFVSFIPICTGSIIVSNDGFYQFLESQKNYEIEFCLLDTEILPSCIETTEEEYIKSISVENYKESILEYLELDFDTNVFYTRKENNVVFVGLKDVTQFESDCRQNSPWYEKKHCRPIEICMLNNVPPDIDGNVVLEGDGLVVLSEEHAGLVVDTPNVSVYDLCNNGNYNEGPPGDAGPVGPIGGGGADGCIDCKEQDCENEYPDACDCEDEE
jgi:hypothetical protein